MRVEPIIKGLQPPTKIDDITSIPAVRLHAGSILPEEQLRVIWFAAEDTVAQRADLLSLCEKQPPPLSKVQMKPAAEGEKSQ